MEKPKKPIQKPRKVKTPLHLKHQMKEKLFVDYAVKARHQPASHLEFMGAAQSAWHGWTPKQRFYVLNTWLTYHPEAARIISDRPWYALGLLVKRKLRKVYREERNPISTDAKLKFIGMNAAIWGEEGRVAVEQSAG